MTTKRLACAVTASRAIPWPGYQFGLEVAEDRRQELLGVRRHRGRARISRGPRRETGKRWWGVLGVCRGVYHVPAQIFSVCKVF